MTDESNPYQIPEEVEAAIESGASANAVESAPCPKCGGKNVKVPSFTWWGGALGPRLFSHVVCLGCKTGFNRKSGNSNNMAITIYLVVSALIGIAVVMMIR